MQRKCPRCAHFNSRCTKNGSFKRRADGKYLQRYKCLRCRKTFSDATHQACYRQKKRKLNPRIYELLCSGVSQRRSAKLLRISRTTVVRKFLFLALCARTENIKTNLGFYNEDEVQFDDLETIEHTKCKPLSVAMAVDKKTRRILAFAVSQMPAKGHLAKIARKKYGYRSDEREAGWSKLFIELRQNMRSGTCLRSDSNPHYPRMVKAFCPKSEHLTVMGQRGCVAGQGELKKVAFDPLFSLNHTFAMCRANINRLFRKTWCTTKRPDRLAAHIELYMNYHNKHLIT